MRGLLFGSAVCALALSAFSVPANAAELVTNGDFETGDFSGWSASVDPGYSGVDGNAPHSGSYGAFFGNVFGTDVISQSIATAAAQTYTVSFWLQLENDPLGEAGPNSVSVSFGGTSLLSLTDSTAFGYQLFSYDVVASGASSSLVFEFHDEPAFWDLDDISVVARDMPAVPEPATWGMLLGGLALAGGMMRAQKRRTIVSFA